MVTLLGVLKDTLESYNPTKFEADKPDSLGVTANRNCLKLLSKATSYLSLRSRTGTFKRNEFLLLKGPSNDMQTNISGGFLFLFLWL